MRSRQPALACPLGAPRAPVDRSLADQYERGGRPLQAGRRSGRPGLTRPRV